MSTYFFIINGRSCHKTTPESTKKPHRIIIGINRVIDFNLKKNRNIRFFIPESYCVLRGENKPNEWKKMISSTKKITKNCFDCK